MTWNHRILAHEYDTPSRGKETYFQIHEVYYDDNGIPKAYTDNPISVGGENIEEILWQIEKIKQCTTKQILWAGDKFPEEYKKNII